MGSKAKRYATAGVTLGGSEVYRAATNRGGRTDGSTKGRTKAEQRLRQGYNVLEDFNLSYDDLIKAGRIQPGQYHYGLSGGESRVSRMVDSYQDSLAASDPMFGSYRKAIQSGMEGVERGDIPDDFRRTLTEDIRKAQAGRGILDSDVAAIEEAVRLSGGREAVRAQRLAEADRYFSSVTSNALGMFTPTLSTYLNVDANERNRDMQKKENNRAETWRRIGLGTDIAGAFLGAGFGGGFGGGSAMTGTSGSGAVPTDFNTPTF